MKAGIYRLSRGYYRGYFDLIRESHDGLTLEFEEVQRVKGARVRGKRISIRAASHRITRPRQTTLRRKLG